MGGDSLSQVPLLESEVDSRRFGLTVHRGTIDAIDERALLQHLEQAQVDVAIVRIPAENAAELNRLDRVGLPYFIADTLVYYSVSLEKIEFKALRNQDVEFVECTTPLIHELDRLVEEIFPTYKNHYSTNPLFAADMLAGYQEWARSYADGSSPERRAWLVRRNGEFVAFATCAFRGDTSEGILYGVSERAAGIGIYGDLIRFTQKVSRKLGAKHMEVSTQSHNYAVQKVWGREGFVPVRSYATAHVNCLFGRSLEPRETVRLRISGADIDKIANATGDFNDLHLSDEFARAIGFTDRIAHGLIPLGAISKHYGTVTPGRGTIFQGYSYRFFRPLYCGVDYRIEFTYPVVNRARNSYRAVARIYEPSGELCLVSYSDRVKKRS